MTNVNYFGFLENKKVVELLRGEKGTAVNIVIKRGTSDVILYKIIRDKIPLYSIDVAYKIAPDIAFVKINRFIKLTFISN